MSSELQIEAYDPDRADRALNDELYGLIKDVFEFDLPNRPEIPFETALLYLRSAPLGGRLSQWIARRDGRVVGRLSIGFPTAENDGVVTIDANVRPDSRRLGIGTALFRTALQPIVRSNRKLVTALGLRDGSPAAAWAERIGSRMVRRDVMLALDIPSVDRAAWAVRVPDGFHLERWSNRTPDQYLETFAVARTAIYDAPKADSSISRPVWTAERVRAEESELRSAGVEQRVVAAVEDATDAIVGFTEMHIRQEQPDFGYQMDTAVLAAHRGMSLGFVLKAGMLSRLIDERPDVVRVATSTYADNIPVIKMNHRLGFETVRSMVTVEIAVPDLCDQLQ